MKRMTTSTPSSLTWLVLLPLTLSTLVTFGQPPKDLIRKNRDVIDRFYAGIEAQNFAVIKELFAPQAQQLIPYAPDGFPKRLDGSEAIYNQFNGLTAYFSQMKFPRTILATENPNFFLVKFKGDMEVKSGGKYENDYIGTFQLKDGKIMEYTEYFNPIVMAKAFHLKID